MFEILLLAALIWFFMQRSRIRALGEQLGRAEADIAGLKHEVALLSGRPRASEAPAAEAPHPARTTPSEQPAASSTSDGATEEPPTVAGGTTSVPPFTPPAPEPLSPPAGPTLEERLGAHWAVIVGGLALAFGGIFLVQYSIQSGLLGPAVRVALGGLLALVLIGAGERFRRGEIVRHLPQLPAAHIPSVLTAAGTVVAFGTIYAAHALYHFIGPALAFVLLGLVAVATMWAAILHGPALAALGLAGAYAVPLLLTSDAPSPWPVVVYTAAVALAAYLLARMRRWLWLAATAVAGAVAWGFALSITADSIAPGSWAAAAFAHAAIQTALAVAFMAWEPHVGARDQEAHPDWIAAAALAALTLLILLVLASAPFAHALWLPFAFAMVALLAVAGWASAPAAIAALLAGVVGIGLVLGWRGLSQPPPASLMAPEAAQLLRLPEHVQQYLLLSTLALVAAALASGRRLWQGVALPQATAGLYALGATIPLLLGLVLAYLRVTQFDTSIRFGFAGLVLSAAFAYGAGVFERSETIARAANVAASPAHRLATGALAAAAIAAFSFALVSSLSRGYLTVAFAVSALGTAFVAIRRDIPLLRYAVTALGIVVVGRLLWDPRIVGASLGTTPIINWLLVGYGVPAVAFAISAILLRRQGDDLAVRLCDGLAVLFAGLLVFFQIHHVMTGGNITRPVDGHVEQGLIATTALGFSYVLARLDLGRANVVFRYGSLAFAVLSLILIVIGLGIDDNPLFSGEPVRGRVVFSSLILGYLLPGIGALLVARQSRGQRPEPFVRAAATVAILLIFGYVSLEVRHAFQGEKIGIMRATSSAEVWAYTAAWLGLAVLFLAYGLWRSTPEPRLASGILIIGVALKVFLLDLSGVSGLWRALSFLCLGAVLIGVGLAYQRLLRGRAPPPTPATVQAHK